MHDFKNIQKQVRNYNFTIYVLPMNYYNVGPREGICWTGLSFQIQQWDKGAWNNFFMRCEIAHNLNEQIWRILAILAIYVFN
jgi:hypothetical protein